jgi:hypothetical protein
MLHRNEPRAICSDLNTLVSTRCLSGPAKCAFETVPFEFLLRCDQLAYERRANQKPLYVLLIDAIRIRYALVPMQVLEG